MSKRKKTRQQAILDIVSRKCVPNQSALLEELKKMNLSVTQATLSRDIAELNLLKSKGGYMRAEDAGRLSVHSAADHLATIRNMVTHVESAQNVLVVRTPRGSARPVGLAFDELVFDNVVGSIAGDDTVIVITATDQDAQRIKESLMKMTE